ATRKFIESPNVQQRGESKVGETGCPKRGSGTAHGKRKEQDNECICVHPGGNRYGRNCQDGEIGKCPGRFTVLVMTCSGIGARLADRIDGARDAILNLWLFRMVMSRDLSGRQGYLFPCNVNVLLVIKL